MTIDNPASTFTTYSREHPVSGSPRINLSQFAHSPRLAELRAVYRSRLKPEERHIIYAPRDAADYLRTIWNKRTIELVEDFVVLYLNVRHEVLGWVKVSSGGISAAQVDQRIVFAIALQTASSAIVVAHNHPTGDLEPSPEDKHLTTRFRDAGQMLRVKLLDHIIISRYASFSFNEHGLL